MKNKKKTASNEAKKVQEAIAKRGCKTCPRWQSFVKKNYAEYGSICAEDACINVIEDIPASGDIWETSPFVHTKG